MKRKRNNFSAVFDASKEEWKLVKSDLRAEYLARFPTTVDILPSTKRYLRNFFSKVWFNHETQRVEVADALELTAKSQEIWNQELERLYNLGRGYDVLRGIASREDDNFLRSRVMLDYKNHDPRSFSCIAHLVTRKGVPEYVSESKLQEILIRFHEIGVFNAMVAIEHLPIDPNIIVETMLHLDYDGWVNIPNFQTMTWKKGLMRRVFEREEEMGPTPLGNILIRDFAQGKLTDTRSFLEEGPKSNDWLDVFVRRLIHPRCKYFERLVFVAGCQEWIMQHKTLVPELIQRCPTLALVNNSQASVRERLRKNPRSGIFMFGSHDTTLLHQFAFLENPSAISMSKRTTSSLYSQFLRGKHLGTKSDVFEGTIWNDYFSIRELNMNGVLANVIPSHQSLIAFLFYFHHKTCRLAQSRLFEYRSLRVVIHLAFGKSILAPWLKSFWHFTR